jgi:hypothetical protein
VSATPKFSSGDDESNKWGKSASQTGFDAESRSNGEKSKKEKGKKLDDPPEIIPSVFIAPGQGQGHEHL